MTLSELLHAIDSLGANELAYLRQRIENRQQALRSPTPGDLDTALEHLRAGLTDQQIEKAEWAMNAEFIQPADKSQWQA